MINGDPTLVILFLLMRTTTASSYILFTIAEEPQGLTVSCLIGSRTNVGSTPHSALSERFGGNSAIKERRQLLLFLFDTSATWGHLMAPDAIHLSNYMVDWMWLPKNDPFIFVLGQTPGGPVISPLDWQVMAFRVDFSSSQLGCVLSKRERCIQEGCYACVSNTWRRSS